MVDNFIVVLYLAGILWLGISSSKQIKDIQNYSIAGKSYGSFVIFATLFASFLGGGFSMGNAEKVFGFGIMNIIALWGFSVHQIIIAKYVAPKIKAFPKAISVGDIMETNFGKIGKIVTGFFATLLCIAIVGVQVSAIGYIFDLFTGVGKLYGILIGCSIVVIYATIGGMHAVVKTDIAQFGILIIGLPLTLIFGIMEVGGVSEVIKAVPDTHWQIPAINSSWIGFISMFFVFLFGEALVPPYVQRLCIGKSEKHTTTGTMWAGIISVPFLAITGGIGLIAFTMNSSLDPNMALPFVINNALPPILKGLVVASIISVVMSSADSFLNSASVALVHDIIQPLRKIKIEAKKELKMAKIATALIGIGAIIFALVFDSIFALIIYAYTFWSPIILPALFMTLIGKKISKTSFILGGVTGCLTVIIWNNILASPYGIDAIPLAILLNYTMIIFTNRLK